jgi:hypothetical protein
MIIIDPNSTNGRRSAPVKGNWVAAAVGFAASAVTVVVEEEVAPVNGSSTVVVLAAATFGATVVVVEVGATVVVVVVLGAAPDVVVVVLDPEPDVVVVVVGGTMVVVVVLDSQESRCRRIPITNFHGAGPSSASACTSPQKLGTVTVTVPDEPVLAPTSGVPDTCGSLTQSIHTQSGAVFGHTGVGSCSWNCWVALS